MPEIPLREEVGRARMTGASTTREDVEQLIKRVEDRIRDAIEWGQGPSAWALEIPATLRAMLAERDALVAECDWTAEQCSNAIDAMNAAVAERDAARAEVRKFARIAESLIFQVSSLRAVVGLNADQIMVPRDIAASLTGGPSHD